MKCLFIHSLLPHGGVGGVGAGLQPIPADELTAACTPVVSSLLPVRLTFCRQLKLTDDVPPSSILTDRRVSVAFRTKTNRQGAPHSERLNKSSVVLVNVARARHLLGTLKAQKLLRVW